jgi:two-component system NtrC family sensor kinase
MVRFSEAAEGNWERSVLIFLVFSVVAISLASIIFKRNVSRPIDRLVTATKEIQKGNLNYRIPPRIAGDSSPPRDELDFLAERFEEMRSALAGKIAELDRANRDLSRRNADVEAALQELRRAQQELVRNERLAATGKMAAQLSHEINNPIHNTQSLLESSLRRLRDEDPARELVALALEEIGRVSRLTRQLLDVYRGSVVEDAHTDVDLAALLRDLERLHAEGLARQGVQLNLHLPPDLPRVLGAPDKLKQVFLNLLLNARDAMPSGGTVTISAARGEHDVTISIADTGVGIPAENKERVFEAFFTTKREVSGVGLGLAVTNGIVRQHQGSVTFQSEVGTGTTFTIRLPVPSGRNHTERHG